MILKPGIILYMCSVLIIYYILCNEIYKQIMKMLVFLSVKNRFLNINNMFLQFVSSGAYFATCIVMYILNTGSR